MYSVVLSPSFYPVHPSRRRERRQTSDPLTTFRLYLSSSGPVGVRPDLLTPTMAPLLPRENSEKTVLTAGRRKWEKGEVVWGVKGEINPEKCLPLPSSSWISFFFFLPFFFFFLAGEKWTLTFSVCWTWTPTSRRDNFMCSIKSLGR